MAEIKYKIALNVGIVFKVSFLTEVCRNHYFTVTMFTYIKHYVTFDTVIGAFHEYNSVRALVLNAIKSARTGTEVNTRMLAKALNRSPIAHFVVTSPLLYIYRVNSLTLGAGGNHSVKSGILRGTENFSFNNGTVNSALCATLKTGCKVAVVKGKMLGGIAVSVSESGNAAPLVACVNRLLALIVLIILTALCATVAVCDTLLSTGGSGSTNKLKAAGVTGLGSKLNAYYKRVTDQEEVVNGLAVYINHKVGSKGIAVGGIKSCEEFDLSVGSYEIVLSKSNAVIARIMPDNTVLCSGSGGGVLLVGDDLIGRYTGVVGLLTNYGYRNSKVESVKRFLRTGEVHKYTHGVVSLGNHRSLGFNSVYATDNHVTRVLNICKAVAGLCLKIYDQSIGMTGNKAVVCAKGFKSACDIIPYNTVYCTTVNTVCRIVTARCCCCAEVRLASRCGRIDTYINLTDYLVVAG